MESDTTIQYTVAEVADLLGISKGLVRKFIRDKRLKADYYDQLHCYLIYRSNLTLFKSINRTVGRPKKGSK